MKTTIGVIIVTAALAGTSIAGEHPEHPKSGAKAAPASKAGPQALDGQSFSGTLVKSGEAAGETDELVFKKGTFTSKACVAHGFKAAPYTTAEKDGVTTFTASASNAGGETMSWTGTVRDGAVEATAVHKAPAGETTYMFKSQAKKSEHPEHPK
jgi:hypothetical protein